MAESAWRDGVRRARAVAWKDLVTERRTKANFASVVSLATLMLLLFGFALGPDAAALRAAAAGVLWLTVIFSGTLAFNRSYQLELEDGAIEQLLLYPGDRGAIFLGKLAANLVFVLSMEAAVIPVAAVLYHISPPPAWPMLLAVLLLGTFGFVTLGTFYAVMASRVRSREVVLPLLLFPMLVPVLIAAAEATVALLNGNLMGDAGAWLRLLVVFDVIFFVAAVLAFPYVVEM
ncbi:MAG TPA: heme exporter protein CcmB [Gemmatimonadaceae bacterium]|nr:heme exporter protein CcmB [Gemmatimonadaceae bacterium]